MKNYFQKKEYKVTNKLKEISEKIIQKRGIGKKSKTNRGKNNEIIKKV